MATATKICRVCGKEYPYCHTERRVAGVFRWQDVACSVEHGSIYLKEILASRGEEPEPEIAKEVSGEKEAEKKDMIEIEVSEKPRKTSAKKAN